ncbi:hypothetical protein B0H63DRAFT_500855 [Podospora didyma]|uniref:T6SS Phospholipase effector Tle1-like catalytic domain-containing protein n=1 Tax=Podospora didyma TaxID=330526 RepID=A0AAE0NU41_9PEZI|nr:hypothetical protein B0H63DRAFT_500855 [Podospora didyma]
MSPHVVPCAHKGSNHVNPKRLVICCDGTWNNANDSTSALTNVSRLSGAVAHKCCSGMSQVVYYHPSAGTETSKVASVLGGMLGTGVAQDIVESYRFICDNYNPGDEIVIIGFSRGAFTARSVAGMVCALGFLNRAGLDQLPHIFKDYQNWHKWHKTTYDPKETHLMGFTLPNLKRLRRIETKDGSKPVPEFEEDLIKEKKEFYKVMAGLVVTDEKTEEKVANLREMARLYREKLQKHGLSLTEKKQVNGAKVRVPVEGRVKAVGVWDTVGSLGIPNPPFLNSTRAEEEIKFESLDVHPNIDYAFHAIALDEWRTAFNCTMWGAKNNDHTQLRQVWFPGTHCNVGGGWPDQQIATIALAWMADQLTSIGVEFDKKEMARIFFTTSPGVKVREWGMGRIHNPEGLTSYPDWIHSSITAPWHALRGKSTDYATRSPGAYKADGKSGELLVNPHELVHPCVRIRYLYDGLTMDDAGPWQCRALTEGPGRYELQSVPEPATTVRKPRETSVLQEYHSVHGPVKSFFDTPPTGSETDTPAPLVKAEQPHEEELHQLTTPKNHWVWVRKSDGHKLPEEHMGMWERRFIKVNNKLLRWQREKEAAAEKAAREASAKAAAESWNFTKLFSGSKPEPVAVAPVAAADDLRASKRAKSFGAAPHYGFHDIVSWQRGDTVEKEKKAEKKAKQ